MFLWAPCEPHADDRVRFEHTQKKPGTGKNKLADRLLELLGLEREYIQLHRDTTVQNLTMAPSLQAGIYYTPSVAHFFIQGGRAYFGVVFACGLLTLFGLTVDSHRHPRSSPVLLRGICAVPCRVLQHDACFPDSVLRAFPILRHLLI